MILISNLPEGDFTERCSHCTHCCCSWLNSFCSALSKHGNTHQTQATYIITDWAFDLTTDSFVLNVLRNYTHGTLRTIYYLLRIDVSSVAAVD